MNCSNCGKNEATVKFVQVVNGVKTELFLCEDCAEEIGFESINLNLPIDFSSFIGDFFDSYGQDELLSVLTQKNEQKCKNCGLSYEEFVKTGKLGCVNCYDVFKDRIDLITKNIQGSSMHVGRGINKKEDFVGDNGDKIAQKNVKTEIDKSSNQVKELKDQLKNAIKEERYEDAAKIRDEIKKFEA